MAVYFQLDGQQIASALEAIGWQSGSGGDASVTYSSTEPTDPSDGNLWYDTTAEKLKIYNGGLWTDVSLSQAEIQNINDTVSTLQTNLDTSQTYADTATLQATIATNKANEIEAMSATATTLPAGSNATASYADGVLSLGIPQGIQGEQGIQGDGTSTIDESWLTETPVISIAAILEENQPTTATITNYDVDVTYNISALKGTISSINADTFTYIAPVITDTNDTTDTISISGYKAGLIRSYIAERVLIVVYVPMTADDVLSNVNFADNEYYNDGVEYL